jgi:putative cell wall-binding protein
LRSQARPYLGYALALLTSLAMLLGPPAARAVDAPYFAWNGSQESMLSEMAIHPSALRIGSVTYLAYEGPGFDPYVAAYDDATGQWSGPVRAGSNPLSLDAHGAPALFADADGYLHLFYGSHFTPMKQVVSLEPGSIDAWEEVDSPSGDATYPQPIQLPDGRLLLFFRQGGSDYYGWVFRTSRDGGRTWDDGFSTVLAGAANGWYAHFASGAGGIVHCAFTRYDPNSSETYLGRRNLYYIWRDRFGTWRNVHGDPVTIPVTKTTADEECGVYDSGAASVNEVVVKDDPSTTRTPAPLIQFITGSGRGEGAFHWMFARPNGATWAVHTVTSTDHSFDAATFDPHADGSVDSYLVTGGSLQYTTRLDPFEGRGGNVERWTSADGGATWTFAERISPDETGTLFSDPQLVQEATPSAMPQVMFTEWTNDHADFFHRLYLWRSSGLVHRPTTPRVDRVAGADRIQTAVAASHAGFAEGAPCVILATMRDYPDALAAAPLAVALRAPVLLVPRDTLPSAVSDEIRRLAPAKVIILGSPKAVASAVEEQVLAETGVASVERIAGSDRYATAIAVARRLGDVLGPLHAAVVVSGRNFPDALAAAPYAAWAGYPILLADGGDRVPTATTAALRDLDVTSTFVVGGGSVVSTAYASRLPAATRLAGADRFQTAAAVARFSLDAGMLTDRVVVASGMGFPDALAGGVLAARARAPMLLTTAYALPAATRDVLSDVATRTVQVWVMGGPSVVDTAPVDEIRGMLGAP